MENNRIQILKEILLDLHQGASPESVQERLLINIQEHLRPLEIL